MSGRINYVAYVATCQDYPPEVSCSGPVLRCFELLFHHVHFDAGRPPEISRAESPLQRVPKRSAGVGQTDKPMWHCDRSGNWSLKVRRLALRAGLGTRSWPLCRQCRIASPKKDIYCGLRGKLLAFRGFRREDWAHATSAANLKHQTVLVTACIQPLQKMFFQHRKQPCSKTAPAKKCFLDCTKLVGLPLIEIKELSIFSKVLIQSQERSLPISKIAAVNASSLWLPCLPVSETKSLPTNVSKRMTKHGEKQTNQAPLALKPVKRHSKKEWIVLYNCTFTWTVSTEIISGLIWTLVRNWLDSSKTGCTAILSSWFKVLVTAHLGVVCYDHEVSKTPPPSTPPQQLPIHSLFLELSSWRK